MNLKQIQSELQFKAIRSSGAGGQHVNKVASKIELSFDIPNSEGLNPSEKEKLLVKLKNRLNKEKTFRLFCEDTRSQHRNKEIAIDRFLQTIKTALKKEKTRKASQPTYSSIKKRLDSKQKQSVKKALRQRPKWD